MRGWRAPKTEGSTSDAAEHTRSHGAAEAWARETHASRGGAELTGNARTIAARIGAEGARVSTDARAATAAESLGADAVTYGGHIAFARDKYRPGTLEGDALLAHELAHASQQSQASVTSGPPARALEVDADRTAASALLGKTTRPALASGLRLSLGGCDGGRSLPDRQRDWLEAARNPAANEAQLNAMMRDDDNVDAIARIGHAWEERTIRNFGQDSDAARRVLTRLAGRFHDRNHLVHETNIRAVLATLGTATADPAVGTAEAAELAQLRRALASDPRHAAMFASVGLDVTNIQIYDSTRAVGGRLYYDPTLYRGVTEGEVTAGATSSTVSTSPVESIHLGPIRIGPHGVQGHSDEYIRSSVYHEALHRSLHIEARDTPSPTTSRMRTIRGEVLSGGASSNSEIEVISRQLETDILPLLAVQDEHGRARDDEVRATLDYLASHFPRANAEFQAAAVQRIVGALTGHPAEITRVLAIIQRVRAPSALQTLTTALTALPHETARPRGTRRPGGRSRGR